MISDKFVFVGALLSIMGSSTYAYHTFKGKTKPNRVTWFLWALAPMVAFTAQIGEGVGLQVVTTFMAGFGPLTVLIASFLNKKAYWRITRLDMVCGALSVVALIFYIVTGHGVIAIALSIFADLLAGVPTLIKAYKYPETEHATVFRNGIISAVITLLTIKVWSFARAGFAVYILLICITLYALIRFKLGTRVVVT